MFRRKIIPDYCVCVSTQLLTQPLISTNLTKDAEDNALLS